MNFFSENLFVPLVQLYKWPASPRPPLPVDRGDAVVVLRALERRAQRTRVRRSLADLPERGLGASQLLLRLLQSARIRRGHRLMGTRRRHRAAAELRLRLQLQCRRLEGGLAGAARRERADRAQPGIDARRAARRGDLGVGGGRRAGSHARSSGASLGGRYELYVSRGQYTGCA